MDNKMAQACGILNWLQGWFKVRDILFLIEDTGGRIARLGFVSMLCPRSKGY
jgi:hypothetical protein